MGLTFSKVTIKTNDVAFVIDIHVIMERSIKFIEVNNILER